MRQRKPQKRKDPIEKLIGLVTQKAESELEYIINSVSEKIENLIIKRKPKIEKTQNHLESQNPVKIKPLTEEERFKKAKDITPKRKGAM